MKEYPLEIESVGEDTYIVMSRGHHDPDLFMKTVRGEGYTWPLCHPEHIWIKTTPLSNGCLRYNPTDKGTRGSWPATWSWEACGEDIYDINT